MKTFSQFINEVQNKMMQYMQSLTPTWPAYIVNELLYKGYSLSQKRHTNNPKEVMEYLQYLISGYGYTDPKQMKWELQDVIIKKDIFDDETQRRMNERGMGQYNPYEVPDDVERNQGAKIRSQQNPHIKVPGYSGSARTEPIILVRFKDGKYELLEGWHRTMQTMLQHPEGYKQQAYVLQALANPFSSANIP